MKNKIRSAVGLGMITILAASVAGFTQETFSNAEGVIHTLGAKGQKIAVPTAEDAIISETIKVINAARTPKLDPKKDYGPIIYKRVDCQDGYLCWQRASDETPGLLVDFENNGIFSQLPDDVKIHLPKRVQVKIQLRHEMKHIDGYWEHGDENNGFIPAHDESHQWLTIKVDNAPEREVDIARYGPILADSMYERFFKDSNWKLRFPFSDTYKKLLHENPLIADFGYTMDIDRQQSDDKIVSPTLRGELTSNVAKPQPLLFEGSPAYEALIHPQPIERDSDND